VAAYRAAFFTLCLYSDRKAPVQIVSVPCLAAFYRGIAAPGRVVHPLAHDGTCAPGHFALNSFVKSNYKPEHRFESACSHMFLTYVKKGIR
jgi:hypothetical protein